MTDSPLSLKRWFIAFLALLCLVLNVGAFVLYEKNQKLVESKAWVQHTYEVITVAYDLINAIQDMQTAQRNYLTSGQDDFLSTYEKNKELSEQIFTQITALTHDNPSRQNQLREQRKIYNRQRAAIISQIEAYKSGVSASTADFDKTRDLMVQLRRLSRQMILEEQQLFLRRSTDEQNSQHDFVMTIFASAGFAIFGLLFANGIVFFLAIRRRQIEEQLIRINKEMENFTYIASHDLRSPLVNLKGFASEIRMGLKDFIPIVERVSSSMSPDDQRETKRIINDDIPDALRFIDAAVGKMDKLTNAILELSRIGRRTLSLDRVQTTRIVQAIVDTLHHQIVSKNIIVEISPLPTIVTDQLALEQIFSNIIDNAIKYLDPLRPGHIEIGHSRTYSETTFWVRDNGRGIHEHDQQKIFEIYRRGGNNLDIPGEGMGMAYVRSTVRRLGGNIWFAANPTHGVTFYFTIPNHLKKDES